MIIDGEDVPLFLTVLMVIVYGKVSEARTPSAGNGENVEVSCDGEFLASSVNQVDYDKVSTVLGNNNFSAGG